MKEKIRKILEKVTGKDAIFDILVPEKSEFGHYSTNLALRLSGGDKLKIAEELARKISAAAPADFFEKVEAAPPGFVNFWLSPKTLRAEFGKISKSRGKYGRSDFWKRKKVMVEFTDPNPFKEFHIGHLYSNIVGEAISRLLEANGAGVKRANYQGDVGLHVAKAVWGMREEMKKKKISLSELERKPLAYRINFMGSAYVAGNRAYEEDDGGKREITEINKKIFAMDPEIKNLYAKGRRWSLDYFGGIYRRLGTKFDFYYFEQNVAKVGLKVVRENIENGIFEKSEGAVVFPGEKYGLHRRVFINSNGLPTYEAKELGLEITKHNDFSADLYLIITGNEIVEYFKVVLAALKRIDAELEKKVKHIAHGMVRLEKGKMSSRTGDIVRAEGLIDEVKKKVLEIMKSSEKTGDKTAESVAVGAIKYSFLKTNIGQDFIFDFERALNLKGDSGPYLQYAYARLRSIVRKAGRFTKADLGLLDKEDEINLIKKIVDFPEVVRDSGKLFSPNLLAKYLYELADSANHYYESTPILKDKNKPRHAARLTLISVAAAVLKNGLGILGIKAPERI